MKPTGDLFGVDEVGHPEATQDGPLCLRGFGRHVAQRERWIGTDEVEVTRREFFETRDRRPRLRQTRTFESLLDASFDE